MSEPHIVTSEHISTAFWDSDITDRTSFFNELASGWGRGEDVVAWELLSDEAKSMLENVTQPLEIEEETEVQISIG